MVLLTPSGGYQQWRDGLPAAVTPDSDGWVSYGDGRLRLVSVAPAELREFGDEPFALSDGLAAWLVTVTVELSHEEALPGCEMTLEDEAGRRFGESPTELSGARLGPEGDSHFWVGCRPGGEEQRLDAPFEIQGLFVLPVTAQPAAVRLGVFGERSYARFPVD